MYIGLSLSRSYDIKLYFDNIPLFVSVKRLHLSVELQRQLYLQTTSQHCLVNKLMDILASERVTLSYIYFLSVQIKQIHTSSHYCQQLLKNNIKESWLIFKVRLYYHNYKRRKTSYLVLQAPVHGTTRAVHF